MKKDISLLELALKITTNPLIIHINPIGMLRIANSNLERFEKLNSIFIEIQNYGGNLAIPTYSYSYTNNEIYDVINTETSLDSLSEYLRKKNKFKRTIDPNFSYLLFGNNFDNKHFSVTDYDSFGVESLIDDIYLHNGYLGAVGGALNYLTEYIYLENKFKVNYRYDKKFEGITIDYQGNKKKSIVTYFCKNRELYTKASLEKLQYDLRAGDLIEELTINEYELTIELIRIKVLANFVQEKILADPKYLWA
jgi:aminoglycoside 3-N-acetyltransferase